MCKGKTQVSFSYYVGKNSLLPYCVFFPCVCLLLPKHFVDTFGQQMYGSFSPPQGILCDSGWVSYNLTEFWGYLPEVNVRSHRLRAHLHKSGPHPHIHTYFKCQLQALCFWPTSYRLEVPKTPSLGLINLLECLTELCTTLTFINLLKGMRKATDEHPDGRGA